MNTQQNNNNPDEVIQFDQQIDKYEQMSKQLKTLQEQCRKKTKELKKQRESVYNKKTKNQTNSQFDDQNAIVPIKEWTQTNSEENNSFLSEIDKLIPENNTEDYAQAYSEEKTHSENTAIEEYFIWEDKPVEKKERKIEIINPIKKEEDKKTAEEELENVIEVEFDDNNNITQVTNLSETDDEKKKTKFQWLKIKMIEMATTRDISYYIKDQTTKKNKNIAYLSLQEVQNLYKIEKNNQREHPTLNQFLNNNLTQNNEYKQNQYTQNEYAQNPYKIKTPNFNINQKPKRNHQQKNQQAQKIR